MIDLAQLREKFALYLTTLDNEKRHARAVTEWQYAHEELASFGKWLLIHQAQPEQRKDAA